MESSPCRRLSLLGIAHPVVGKTFQVLEVHQEKALHEVLVEKKVKDGLFLFCKSLSRKPDFCYILDCYPVSVNVV